MSSNKITLELPPSKSLTQRYLIMAALAASPSLLLNPSICNDSQDLMRGLTKLGIRFEIGVAAIKIFPEKLDFPSQPIYCGDGATTARFLSAFSLLTSKSLLLTASSQLESRPMSELFNLLKKAGVQVKTGGEKKCFPCQLHSKEPLPKQFKVDCSRSSQFLSALLMVSSRFPHNVSYFWDNPVSETYIKMTLAVMKEFSINFKFIQGGVKVFPGAYPGKKIGNEPDLSLYPFAFMAGKISSSPVEIKWKRQPLDRILNSSKQGDKIFATWYRQLGAGKTKFNLKAHPDLFPPLLLAGIVNKKQISFTGVSHLQYKESNRGAVMARELLKLGIKLKISENRIELTSTEFINGKNIEVDPASDHRLAMFFALLSIIYPGKITVKNKECTAKSWPGFWKEMKKLK